MVNEMVRARDGALWIGTRDGLLIRSPDGRKRWIRELLGTRLGRITAIGEDADGHMWIGSGAAFSGAFCWDGRTWKHFGQKEGLSAPRIHRIARDRKGRLWFLGLNRGVITGDLADEPGAFVLDGNRFVRWGRAEGLLDGRVYAFVEDATGGYWFGTWLGLSRFRDGKWTYWQAGKGLLGARIWTLAEHPDGRILFSHQYAGLGYIDARDSAHYVTEDDGLIGDEVAEVEVDKRGWIWVATTDGLGCWTGNEWVRFDSHTGLPNDRLWPVLPLDREVLVGTQGDGVAILQLDSLNAIPPRVRIGNPIIEDNNVVLSWIPYAYWGDVPSEDIQTRFRLSGSPWSSWSTQRSIAIRELSAGAYRFEVQAKGPLGETGAAPAAYIIEIPPPVYLRPAAIIPIASLCALVVILAVIGWMRHLSYNRKIRENEARFRAQYKGNPVPTFTYRKSGNDFFLSDFNDAAEKLTLGRSREWQGRRFEELLPNGIDAKALLEECVKQQATVRRDYRYALDGVSGYADLAVTFAFVPPDLILVHTEDVTARKHNEEILQESREQLRALAARLQSVREEERTLLSREIHDELGQLMTGLKMDLAWIRRRILELGNGLPDVVTQRMAQMNGLLEDAIHTVRKIAGQLRPAILDDLGLIPAIEWQARDFGNRTGIACEINLGVEDLHGTLPDLSGAPHEHCPARARHEGGSAAHH
jgi:signal transduction histidine kinase